MMRVSRWLVLFTIWAVLAGCSRRTPEERMQEAVRFLQQNDVISAEMEARKVIETTPDDPIAIQARHLLAEIYSREERIDDAVAELEAALEKVSQNEEMGRRTLQAYLAVLQRGERYDDALKTVDKYQKEYADNEGTSLSLEVARIEIQTRAGETTTARQSLQRLRENTTGPAELALYRNLTMTTFQRDGDTTSGIEFLEGELAANADDTQRREIISTLARSYASVENYERTRESLVEATQLYDRAYSRELDINVRTRMAYDLGVLYAQTGNLAGARRVFQALFDSNAQNQQIIMVVSDALVNVLLQQGEYAAFIGFLKEAAQRFPNLPFAQNAAQAEAMHAAGQLSVQAPQDTSTLTMAFREGDLLVPQNLPRSIVAETTGPQSLARPDEPTTGTATIPTEVDTVATEDATTAVATPSAPPEPVAPTATPDAPAPTETPVTDETITPGEPAAAPDAPGPNAPSEAEPASTDAKTPAP